MTDRVSAHAGGGAFKSQQEHPWTETSQKKTQAVFAESTGDMLTLNELPTLTPTKAEAGVRAANKAAIVASAGAMVTSNQCSLVKRCTRQNRSLCAIVVFPVPFKDTFNMPPELLNLGGSAFFFLHVALLVRVLQASSAPPPGATLQLTAASGIHIYRLPAIVFYRSRPRASCTLQQRKTSRGPFYYNPPLISSSLPPKNVANSFSRGYN